MKIEERVMDYKEKYEQALQCAKELYECHAPFTQKVWIENIFPELKESKDEKIRKYILSWMETMSELSFERMSFDKKDVIAWLEKQGEQKPAGCDCEREDAFSKQLEIWFEKGKCSGRDEVIFHPENFGLQKPAEWSEEDERLKTSCVKHIEEELERVRNDKYGHSEIISDLKESCRERIKWLESIRPQSRWKPSGEMLEALYRTIPENTTEMSEDEMLLNKLYQGLKYGRVLSEN